MDKPCHHHVFLEKTAAAENASLGGGNNARAKHGNHCLTKMTFLLSTVVSRLMFPFSDPLSSCHGRLDLGMLPSSCLPSAHCMAHGGRRTSRQERREGREEAGGGYSLCTALLCKLSIISFLHVNHYQCSHPTMRSVLPLPPPSAFCCHSLVSPNSIALLHLSLSCFLNCISLVQISDNAILLSISFSFVVLLSAFSTCIFVCVLCSMALLCSFLHCIPCLAFPS